MNNKKLTRNASVIFLSLFLSACGNRQNNYDASGTFEATEIMVPAQANGIIEAFKVNEGENLDSGIRAGFIDTTQLYLKKKQLEAQVKATGAKLPNIAAQTAQFKQQAAVIQSRINYLEKEQQRTQNLVKADAATPKQLDDINAQLDEARQQLKAVNEQGQAQTSALTTSHSGISSEISPLILQIKQIDDQLKKAQIINPVKGTVLTKFAEQGEMAVTGKPLYSIADLSTLTLRAYITEKQLGQIRLGQSVKVMVDDSTSKMKTYAGTVTWISDEAEFTPKTIQTKDERANLVYAVKINVNNDGYLKIGMYGEVSFTGK
ncbi:MAG TPA: HlyD family efflux transporter periplasmic adaptor subunit [Hanamia sp.]|nr:HlyD family efflux transporter periplasmic adaptor subunit [Hanamia sp.]